MATAPSILIEPKFLPTCSAPVTDYRCVVNADATVPSSSVNRLRSPNTTTMPPQPRQSYEPR